MLMGFFVGQKNVCHFNDQAGMVRVGEGRNLLRSTIYRAIVFYSVEDFEPDSS
jgi:hypothetical protein